MDSETDFWNKAEQAMANLKIDDKEEEEGVSFEKQKLKSYNKEYYERNKEKRKLEWIKKKNDPSYTYDKEYYKEYYAKNRQKIIDYQTRKVTCECGSVVAYANLTHHRRYTTHKLNLKKKEELENKEKDGLSDNSSEVPELCSSDNSTK